MPEFPGSHKSENVHQAIIQLMLKLKDTQKDADKCMDFMKQLIHEERASKTTLPLIEMITVIKFEKPTLYKYLEELMKRNLALQMLIGFNMDYKVAKQKIYGEDP